MLGAPSTKQTGKRQEVKTAIHKGVLNLFNHVIHHPRSIGGPIQAFMANPTVRKSLTCRADPAKRNHGTEYFWTTSLLEAHSFGPTRVYVHSFLHCTSWPLEPNFGINSQPRPMPLRPQLLEPGSRPSGKLWHATVLAPGPTPKI